MERKLRGLCLLGWLAWVVACIPTISEPEPIISSRPERWPDELMWVRPQGATGGLVAYNMANGRETFIFPPGRLSADGEDYYAASWQNEITLIDVFDAAQGRQTGHFSLNGRWELGGVSPNGRWLALTDIATKQQAQATYNWQTNIQVVAAEDGRIAHTLQLEGNFEIDAISNQGTGLFLIQYVPPDQPEQYLVRLYDLTIEELLPDPLRDKRILDEVMTGYAWGSVADPRGEWWLTLYLSTQRNKAFIHALNLQNRFTFCIDLPSGDGNFDTLRQYTLVLSPDGRTIYAANAALGVMAEVSLAELKVMQEVPFSNRNASADPATTFNSSVVSSNGDFVYFTDGRQVWMYDTTAKEVSKPYLDTTDALIQGLAVSQDGGRLYVAMAERPLQVFNTVSGATLVFPGEAVSQQP